MRRALILLLFGLVLAGGAAVTWQAMGKAKLVEEDLTTARALLARAGGFESGELKQHLGLVQQAEQHSRRAQQRLDQWPPRQLGRLPLVGRDIRVAKAVAASATGTVRATRRVVTALQPVQTRSLNRASILGAAELGACDVAGNRGWAGRSGRHRRPRHPEQLPDLPSSSGRGGQEGTPRRLSKALAADLTGLGVATLRPPVGGPAGLQRDLRRWYFDVGGGLYMSENARDRYGQLQALLAAVIANYPKLQNDRGQPSDGTSLDLQESCSALRTALTEDLETRAQRSVLRSIRLLGRHFLHHRRGERRIARAARRPGEPVRLPIEDWQQPNRTLREAGAEPWWMRFRAVVARWRAGPRPAAGPGPGSRRRRRRGCG